MKKNIKTYLIFLFLTIFIVSLKEISGDEVWSYGFSYNIASGLIPYKDFNMVQSPLYSLIFQIPMRLVGNYYISFLIANCLLYSFVFTLIYNKIGKKVIYLLLSLGLCLNLVTYNVFCVMLLLLILLLIDSNYKYKNIIIGILIGMIAMTKQNIGLCLLIIYIFDNRKDILSVFKSLLYVSIPIFLILLYLIYHNTLYEYYDFCYLGLGNFTSNLFIDPFSIIILIIVIFGLLHSYLKTKNIKCLYVLFFQSIAFPLIDYSHIMLGFIPFVYLILLNANNKYFVLYTKMFIVIGYVLTVIGSLSISSIIIDNSYLTFTRNPNGTKKYLYNFSKYIDSKEKDYKVYIFNNAYPIRLYRNENPGFFDFILTGNMGSDEKKYLKQIDKECKNIDCLFILDGKYFLEKIPRYYQSSFLFKNYVLEHAEYYETIPSNDRVYIMNHKEED